MTPSELVREWVARFNAADADRLAELYADSAVNHQVALEPVEGRDAIHAMFAREFAQAKNPLGLRGCGFFHVKDDKIVFQRGYWDMLSFQRAHKAE